MDAGRSGCREGFRSRIVGSPPCRNPVAAGDLFRVKTHSTYDRFPAVHISDSDAGCYVGWAEICQALQPLVEVTVVEVYPGCDTNGIEASLTSVLKPDLIIRSEEALLPADVIEKKIYSTLGTDRVFAFMHSWTLGDFFCPDKLTSLRSRIHACAGPVLVIGRVPPSSPIMTAASFTQTSRAGKYRQGSARTGPQTSALTTAMPHPVNSIAAFFPRLACRGSPKANPSAEDRLSSGYPSSR